jgi:hypothetical protein
MSGGDADRRIRRTSFGAPARAVGSAPFAGTGGDSRRRGAPPFDVRPPNPDGGNNFRPPTLFARRLVLVHRRRNWRRLQRTAEAKKVPIKWKRFGASGFEGNTHE